MEGALGATSMAISRLLARCSSTTCGSATSTKHSRITRTKAAQIEVAMVHAVLEEQLEVEVRTEEQAMYVHRGTSKSRRNGQDFRG